MRDQLQGLVGPGLLGEDASLPELSDPLSALDAALLDVGRRQPGGHDDPPDHQQCRGRRDYESYVELPVRSGKNDKRADADRRKDKCTSTRPTIGSEATPRWSSSTLARLPV